MLNQQYPSVSRTTIFWNCSILSSCACNVVLHKVHNACADLLCYCRIRLNDDANTPDDSVQSTASNSSLDLRVGILHYSPGHEIFPLLQDAASYIPDTSDMNNAEQRDYWLKVLRDQIPTVVEKAISTGGSTSGQISTHVYTYIE